MIKNGCEKWEKFIRENEIPHKSLRMAVVPKVYNYC
jgi:hypothetical protein